MKPSIYLFLFLSVVLFALNGCENSDNAGIEKNSLQLTEVTAEQIEEDYTASRSMVVKNGIAYHVYSKEIDPSSGNGSSLYLYIRDLESDSGEMLELEHLSHLKIGMFSVTQHPDADKLYIQYVDRTDDRDRTVFVDEFDIESREFTTLFEYNDPQSNGVLNPISVVNSIDNQLHILIPDRAERPIVRWFKLSLDTSETERLNDIQFETRGIRTYGYAVQDQKLYLPVNTVGKLYLVTLDLQKQELVSSVVIDEIDHSEPTRMTDIYFYPDNRAVITYMRPADFSNRPETGLIGSLIANVVDINEGVSLFKETLAGNSGSEAVTFYIASDKVDDEHFVTIHTTVNKIHTWHINEVHDNYNQTTLGLYKLEDTGIRLIDQVISQPSWANRVTAYENLVIATYNYATDTHESRLNIYRTD